MALEEEWTVAQSPEKYLNLKFTIFHESQLRRLLYEQPKKLWN